MTLSIDIQHNNIECHYAECLYAECLYAECHDYLIITLTVVMLSVVAPFVNGIFQASLIFVSRTKRLVI